MCNSKTYDKTPRVVAPDSPILARLHPMWYPALLVAALALGGCSSSPEVQSEALAEPQPPVVLAEPAPVEVETPAEILFEEIQVEEVGLHEGRPGDSVMVSDLIMVNDPIMVDDPIVGPAAVSGELIIFHPSADAVDGLFGDVGAVQADKLSIKAPERAEVAEVIKEFMGASRKSMERALWRSGRYMKMIMAELEELGLPPELSFLPVVESHYRTDARSHAGAVGMWQFIDTTARANNLRVDWWVDERLDPVASTRGAAYHLSQLHKRFGDWELALAAYNAGAGGISRALSAGEADDFWGLLEEPALKAETRRYVPKFYAAMAVMNEPTAYGFDDSNLGAPIAFDTVEVDSPVDLKTVSRLASISFADLLDLNPALLRGVTPPGGGLYPLKVTAGRGEEVADIISRLGQVERLDFKKHRIKRGDNLGSIALKFGTRISAIAQLNGIRNPRLIRPGRDLVIPVRTEVGATFADLARGRMVHKVKPGESTWNISRKYGVSVAAIARWNALGPRRIIRAGQRLIVSREIEHNIATAQTGDVYVVMPGDTLWSISRATGATVGQLQDWNSIAGGGVLHPGDRLRVVPIAD